MYEVLLASHIAATWFLVGLIWLVQIVHYPLMRFVRDDVFVSFETEHCSRIGRIVGPVMCLEALTAVALVFIVPLHSEWITSLALLVVIWLSTALVQMPLHSKLAAPLADEDRGTAIAALVSSNWIRTIAWTLRGATVLMLTTNCRMDWY